MIEFATDFQKENILKKSIFSLIYIFAFIYIYNYYLYTVWKYFGYGLNKASLIISFLTIVIAYLPILFYRGLKSVSSYFGILIYVLGYVPIILSLSYNSKNNYSEILSFQLAFLVGMSIIFCTDRFRFHWNVTFGFQRKMSFMVIHLITLILTFYMLFLFNGRMRFVNIREVYALRSSNNELMTHGFNGYFIMWLTYCFYPLYFAIGIMGRKLFYSSIGLSGGILVFMITGTKAGLFMPIILFCFYFILRRKSVLSFFHLFVIGIVSLSTLIFMGGIFFKDLATMFFMRTLSMPGLLTSQYVNFFSSHPYTFYSHINLINKITGIYPYGDKSVGEIVGRQVYSAETNSNALFWATDGIAAIGQAGVIFISLILGYFLLYLNSKLRDKKPIFVFLVLTPLVLTLLNSSFFTTLLSGGLIISIIILLNVNIPYVDSE